MRSGGQAAGLRGWPQKSLEKPDALGWGQWEQAQFRVGQLGEERQERLPRNQERPLCEETCTMAQRRGSEW